MRIMVTEPWAPVSRSDMPSLTGLRCLAASAVFFAHISFALSETSLASALPWPESIGRTGVALFFVLSGYLLTQPGTLRGGLRSYGARRFARVYPTYLVATATFVAVGYVQNPSNLPRAGNALLNVSLLQSWAWGGWDTSINFAAWSLSVEVLFYALLPVVTPLMTRAVRMAPTATFAILATYGCSMWALARFTPRPE